MIKKLKKLFGFPSTRPVFVIGTGRSGTHWLGYSLGSHPEVCSTIEEQPMFGLSTKMALNSNLEKQLFDQLVSSYKEQLLHTSRDLYLDKSHPNIWIAEKLKRSFPNSLFIGIERSPYATVASMLKHKGVLSWHQRWKEFPIPNRFLGISDELAKTYDAIPLASKCAMRWLAHHEQMMKLKDVLGDDLLIISYESFAFNTESEIKDLQLFLNLKNPISIPEVKTESLHKWKLDLSDEQLKQVQNVVGVSPEEY